jgi:hypothetical protein
MEEHTPLAQDPLQDGSARCEFRSFNLSIRVRRADFNPPGRGIYSGGRKPWKP